MAWFSLCCSVYCQAILILKTYSRLLNIEKTFEYLCSKISKFIVEEMHLSKHSYSSARDLDDSIKKVFKLRCFNCGDSTR